MEIDDEKIFLFFFKCSYLCPPARSFGLAGSGLISEWEQNTQKQ